MELRQLRHFLAVVETRSFSEAGRRAHLTQPALSRSIQTLEEDLGVSLLDRGPRGTSITPAGRRFVEHARLILSDCDRARDGLATESSELTGRVSIGVAALFGSWIADAAVARICREQPQIRIAVTEGYYEDLVAGLPNGRFDFILTNMPETCSDREIVTEHLLDLSVSVVAGASHELAHQAPLATAEVARNSWVIVNHPHSLDAFRQFFLGEGLDPPPFVATNSLALLRSLVGSGSHLSMVCESVVHAEIKRGLVKRLKMTRKLGQRRGGLIYLRRNERPAAVAFAMQVMRECCPPRDETKPGRDRSRNAVARRAARSSPSRRGQPVRSARPIVASPADSTAPP